MHIHKLEDLRENKELFLYNRGILASNNIEWAHVPAGYVIVVLLKDKERSAALILLNAFDLRRSRCATDKRARKTYLVAVKDLLTCVDRDCVEALQKLQTSVDPAARN